MKLQCENHRDLTDLVEELTKSSLVYGVHVRDRYVEVISGEVRKETIEWLSKSKVKVLADKS